MRLERGREKMSARPHRIWRGMRADRCGQAGSRRGCGRCRGGSEVGFERRIEKPASGDNNRSIETLAELQGIGFGKLEELGGRSVRCNGCPGYESVGYLDDLLLARGAKEDKLRLAIGPLTNQ